MSGEWRIRGVRGATTVESNTKESIEKSTVEMLEQIVAQNKIKVDDISHVTFTVTHDIDADFPAKYARTRLGWDNVAMICTREIPVPGSTPLCIRVMLVVNTKLSHQEVKHVYLRGAKGLRPDLVNK